MDYPTLNTDEELARMSLGDARVFGELVRRYESKLSSYIHRLGHLAPEDNEDVLQEVFLKTYQNLNGFDASYKFSSWIYRIAHNETMAFFRKRTARPHGHAVEGADEVIAQIASELDVERETVAKDDARRLADALDALPERYRDVLVLHYFEHAGYDEISDILAIPPGTVATRLYRAKARLYSLLTTQGFTYD